MRTINEDSVSLAQGDYGENGPPWPGLANRLRSHTRPLHSIAESTGIIADILQGRATCRGYALLMRNLLPAYLALEQALENQRSTQGAQGAGRFAYRELYRAAALRSDIKNLDYGGVKQALPLLQESLDYAQQIEIAAEGDGSGLIAHAYVRYLGDLSGGPIMGRLLAKSLGLNSATLAFYEYAGIPDTRHFKARFRRDLDLAGTEVADAGKVLAEASLAFQLNVNLSTAVQREVIGLKSAGGIQIP